MGRKGGRKGPEKGRYAAFHKAMISILGERDSRQRSVVIFEERCVQSIGAKESIILSPLH
jgi:hypothetical protein